MYRRYLSSLLAMFALAMPLRAGALERPAEREGATASGLSVRISAAGAVRAGDLVEVRWDGATRDIREFELLLSLDGGRHWTRRISPELDPRVGAYVWRVPAIAAADARIMARFNRDGEELAGVPSAPFRILKRDREAPGALPEFSGAGPEPDAPVADGAASELSHERRSLSEDEWLGAGAPPRDAAVLAPDCRRAPEPLRREQSRTQSCSRPLALPRYFPLRN